MDPLQENSQESQDASPSRHIQTPLDAIIVTASLTFSNNVTSTETIPLIVVPPSPVIYPASNSHQNDKFSESGQEIGQPSESTDVQLQLATLKKKSKRREMQSKLSKLPISDVEKPESNDLTEKILAGYSLESSMELKYHGRTTQVNVEQLERNKMLGYGCFGCVYTVDIKTLTDVSIAVKRIPIQTKEDALLSIEIELTTMKTIGQETAPYLIEYYGAGFDRINGEVCICMELMATTVGKFYPGLPKAANVASDRFDRFLRRCAYNVTKCLCFLETKGIVHRDVKPANMLINKHGLIKLCDFGICGNLLGTSADFSTVLGTAAYMPPERERPAIQADMWALGVSLLEIINNKQPSADYSLRCDLSDQILEWKSKISTMISHDMQEFILHLLKKDPTERPRSYLDILNKPAICNMNDLPSDDEINLVAQVIGIITKRSNPND